MSPKTEQLPPPQLVRKWYEDNFPLWRGKREAAWELRRFLAGDRYQGDTGEFNRQLGGIQIRGQDTQDTIRHGVAKATEKPRSVEGRPKDNVDDPDAAEQVVALITDQLSDPYKGFERERYMAIQAAKESRAGIVWMDWVPDFGPFGEIFYTYTDASRVMWSAPYHPHHPLCDRLLREKRIDVDRARAMYKAPWLEPDRAQLTGGGDWKAGVPLIDGYSDRLAQVCIRDNNCTIWELWIKNDPTESPGSTTQASDVLKPNDRYMSCVGGCGYRSETQAVLQKKHAIAKGIQLPDSWDQMCPTCGGDLMRIDARDTNAVTLAYSRGRRLIVDAPFSPAPDPEKCLYDGDWPIPKARSFPAYFVFASVKPGDVYGPCDTDWMWDQQIAQDRLDTIALQRVFEYRDFWVFPELGIKDAKNKRFEMRNDQRNIAFRDATITSMYGPQAIEHYTGTGVDPNYGLVRNIMNQNLTRYRPTGDIGLTREDSKNIAVGTVEAVERQGEVPNEDFKRRDAQELSMFYGVHCDYTLATLTPEKLSRLNVEGQDILLNLSGDDYPNFDFVVSETPAFTGIEKERALAWDAAIQTAMQLGPESLDAWGQFHNVPRTVIRAIQKLLNEKKAADEQAAAEAEAMGGAPGDQGQVISPLSEDGGPGAAPMMNGPSGGGMAPQPVA